MIVNNTEIDEVKIIRPKLFEDDRGWFYETYSKQRYSNSNIISEFIQENQSLSKHVGTIRGIHFQNEPFSQAKLVRCTKGAIRDFAVDLRRGSPTYKKWVSVELTEDNKLQLFIPRGFGHGFITLTDNTEVQYKVDNYYSKEHDRSILYNDTDIGIDWRNINPIISDKDKFAPLLNSSDVNFKYKYLVTGAYGQVGSEVVTELERRGLFYIAPTKSELDITNKHQVKEYIFAEQPDIVIHCAAYTNVDKAEEDKTECNNVNYLGTCYISDSCKRINSKLVYISTDYVFDGDGDEPHLEEPGTSPLNYYGYTKKLAEDYIINHLENYLIVRTSWVYGENGSNFVKTMLELSKKYDSIDVVNDQIGSPTFANDLALYLINLIFSNNKGIFHAVNQGYCSWYEFTKEIYRIRNIKTKINPIVSEQYPTKAKRPKNSRLSTVNSKKLSIPLMPSWQSALRRFLDENMK